MVEIIGVRFRPVGKIYYFDPDGMNIEKGQNVIVETARGIEYGAVVIGNREVEDESITSPLKKVIRVATPEDDAHLEENIKRADDAYKICEKKIAQYGLEMKLIYAEYTFDNNKILFYFTAYGRIDFRELVKDLASVFRTRIELRQIGVRDEAKHIGGLGVCGKPLCCATFLGDFQPVSIKMAKEQNLSLNPTKISGTCGRLMCCLKYEQEAYEDLIKSTPKMGAFVSTPDGNGTVVELNLIKGELKVRLNSAPDAVPKTYTRDQLKTIKDGRVVVTKEELAALKNLE